ncbi:hypothetical protein J1614_011102 [Plenodomus biglobosus]|nr:hypothetical protein J1614_011102 [Plenodomus biglobosus]
MLAYASELGADGGSQPLRLTGEWEHGFTHLCIGKGCFAANQYPSSKLNCLSSCHPDDKQLLRVDLTASALNVHLSSVGSAANAVRATDAESMLDVQMPVDIGKRNVAKFTMQIIDKA